MGEMIKFGIKMALTIACAGALIAAILILFNLVSSLTFSASSPVTEIFYLVSLFFPINLRFVFTCITSLFSFKVAYWAADKMLQFINALG